MTAEQVEQDVRRLKDRIRMLHAAIGHASDEYIRGRLTEEQYSFFVDELRLERAALHSRAGLPNDEV